MAYVVMLIAVLVILLGVLARRLLKARADRPLNIEDPTPTFQVVALGLQGSGKTLLLASMYHRLKTPTDQCYFFTTPFDDVLQLNQWYGEMANTASQTWPHGTAKGETRHFTFTVKTSVAGPTHTVLHLKYLEYAGELLTEIQAPGSTVQERLHEHITSADALIGVIDGYRIRQLLDRHPEGPMRLEQTLNALVPAMIEATCPVSFVITKWDLLADRYPDESTRLSAVHDLLMSNDHFRSLVELHSATRVVRLIPVSAVGAGFATIGSQGEIVKVPQHEVRPTNVDVPLSTVVPDLFDQVRSRLDRQTYEALETEVRRRRQDPLEALTTLGAFAGKIAGRTLAAAFGPVGVAALAGGSLLELFLDSQTGVPSERRRRLTRELTETEQRIEQFRIARQRVLHDMRRKVDVLEDRLPHSRLSRGRWHG